MSNSPKAPRPRQPGQRLSEHEADLLSLSQHLQRLVDADPEAAKAALEASPEHAPELYLIAINQFQRDWVTSLMNSDSMQIHLSRGPQAIKNLLEQPDIESLLEQIP